MVLTSPFNIKQFSYISIYLRATSSQTVSANSLCRPTLHKRAFISDMGCHVVNMVLFTGYGLPVYYFSRNYWGHNAQHLTKVVIIVK